MTAVPNSIFANLSPWAILARLATIKVEAADFDAVIPELVVVELLRVLEEKLPEVRLAINEMPPGELTPNGIEHVIMSAEAAIDARNAYRVTS